MSPCAPTLKWHPKETLQPAPGAQRAGPRPRSKLCGAQRGPREPGRAPRTPEGSTRRPGRLLRPRRHKEMRETFLPRRMKGSNYQKTRKTLGKKLIENNEERWFPGQGIGQSRPHFQDCSPGRKEARFKTGFPRRQSVCPRLRGLVGPRLSVFRFKSLPHGSALWAKQHHRHGGLWGPQSPCA